MAKRSYETRRMKVQALGVCLALVIGTMGIPVSVAQYLYKNLAESSRETSVFASPGLLTCLAVMFFLVVLASYIASAIVKTLGFHSRLKRMAK